MIQERYCSYEVSKLLQEKGFDEPCRSIYIDCVDYVDFYYSEEEQTNLQIGVFEVLRPTHQMTMDWLRKKGFYIEIQTLFNEFEPSLLKFTNFHALITIIIDGRVIDEIHLTDEGIKDYGECVENAIKYCLTELMKGDKG